MTDRTEAAWGNDDEQHLLFTEQEIEYLANEKTEAPAEKINQRLASKLTTVIHELDVAWHYLPEEVLEQAFGAHSSHNSTAIRGRLLSLIALGYYGDQLNNDDAIERVCEAIRGAEAARGNHAAVDFDVRTSSMLTPEEVIEKLESGDERGISFAEYTNLWYDDAVSPDRIAGCELALFSEAPNNLVAEIRTLREEEPRKPRPPVATVADVAISELERTK